MNVKGLSGEEICILALVEEGAIENTASTISQLGLPRRLLEMGLVIRDAEGNPKLTRDGRGALFRSRCAEVLRHATRGEPLDAHIGVETWLRNSRFLTEPLADSAALPQVTPRGKEWLASLDHEEISLSQPGLKKRMLLPKLLRWLERK